MPGSFSFVLFTRPTVFVQVSESTIPAKPKAVASLKQAGGAESVKSDQSSVKTASKGKPAAKVKHPAAPTKGPQRKGLLLRI